MEPSTAPLSALAYVLRAKIGITLVFWCVPLLLFPKNAFEWLGFREVGSVVFLKLLGMAYLALVAGYYLGYREIASSVYPANTVRVGIVSNLGAFLLLVYFSLAGSWDSWGILAQLFMWASLLATGSLSAALVFLHICNEIPT